jgi:hypothetical protein
MNGIEQLKRRTAALAPDRTAGGLSDSEIAVRNMSDDEIEQRVKKILGGNTDHIDPDLVRQARHISIRGARI